MSKHLPANTVAVDTGNLAPLGVSKAWRSADWRILMVDTLQPTSVEHLKLLAWILALRF